MLLYRGRIAPSPTGYLHLGHARTFWTAQERARSRQGTLIFRNEDLDRQRCRPEFVSAMGEDLHWLGVEWQEGPDVGGPFAPYAQSERYGLYREALERLREAGFIYPCRCSRRDLGLAASAPHDDGEEPLYPGTCRPPMGTISSARSPQAVTWRFRVPEGERVGFTDLALGPQAWVSGRDFGDFVVWRRDDVPAYQLAVVVDDAAMRCTEVVRGADLLLSTARQLLLYSALGLVAPDFFHCPLVLDESGVRLAKRHDALSLRALRQRGLTPSQVRDLWQAPLR
jgi:glutamyl/glutaminyl-tRNA synthetase